MKEINEITSIEELKEGSIQYVKISRDLAQSEVDMNKEIDKIKNRYDVKNASNKAVKTALFTMIQAYVTENKEPKEKKEVWSFL